MIIKFTLSGTIEVPEGSRLDKDSPRMILLPDGNHVKLFPVFELNDDRDMTWFEAALIGLDIDNEEASLTVITADQ